MAEAQRQCGVLRKRTYSKPSCVWILLAQERIFCALAPRWSWNLTGLGWVGFLGFGWLGLGPQFAVTSTFSALRSPFTPGCIFIILIPISGHGRRGPAPSFLVPMPIPLPLPLPFPVPMILVVPCTSNWHFSLSHCVRQQQQRERQQNGRQAKSGQVASRSCPPFKHPDPATSDAAGLLVNPCNTIRQMSK